MAPLDTVRLTYAGSVPGRVTRTGSSTGGRPAAEAEEGTRSAAVSSVERRRMRTEGPFSSRGGKPSADGLPSHWNGP